MRDRDVKLSMKRGDAKRFRLRVFDPDPDDPTPEVSLASVVVRFQARYRPADAAAVIDCTTANGGIVVVDAPAGVAEVRVPEAATLAVVAPATLVWDCEVDDGSGPETVLAGLLTIEPDVARA